MVQRLPRTLVASLLLLAAASLTASMYLEIYQLRWLQDHPVSTNLLSASVGFACGILVLATGANWLIERERLVSRRVVLSDALSELWFWHEGLAAMASNALRSLDISSSMDVTMLEQEFQALPSSQENDQAVNALLEQMVRACDGFIKNTIRKTIDLFGLSDPDEIFHSVRTLRTVMKEVAFLLSPSYEAHAAQRKRRAVTKLIAAAQAIEDAVLRHHTVARFTTIFPYAWDDGLLAVPLLRPSPEGGVEWYDPESDSAHLPGSSDPS